MEKVRYIINFIMSIIVKPISANLTRDTDFIDDMDPYAEIIIGSQKKRTATRHGAGKNPSWVDTLVFNSNARILTVKVWDSDTFSADDIVGEGSMNLNSVLANPNRTQNQYVDLTYNGKTAGRILLSVQYQGPSIGGNNNNWGNNMPNTNNWNNNNNNGWGNNNNGWGNNNNNNNGWGTNPINNNGWGNNNNNGWGSNPNNNGWGNNNNNGWGNNNNNAWNNNNNNGWGSNPNNNGWNNNNNNGWNNNNNNGWNNNNNNGWNNNNGFQNNSFATLTFVVKPIEAQLSHDLDTFSKMDPFVQISIGNNRQRTKTQHGAGKYPKFVDTLSFSSGQRLMMVTVYDQDVTCNELVGQGTMDLNKAANNIGMAQNDYVNLICNGQTAGRILISVEARQGNTGYGW